MLITGMDDRNVIVAIDLKQAKELVEALRTLKVSQFVEATEVMYKAGFNTTGFDVQAAVNSFCSVVGFITDRIIYREVPLPTPKEDAKPPEPVSDEPKVPETKVWKM